MYLLDGVALDNEERSWLLRATSRPLSQYSARRSTVTVPGHDGVVDGIPATVQSENLALVVQTPRSELEALNLLATKASTLSQVLGESTRELLVEFVSSSNVGYGPGDEVVDVTLLFRAPKLYWRDAAVTTEAASADDVIFEGSTAPVRDMIIRASGAFTDITISGNDGSWLKWAGTVPSGSRLLLEVTEYGAKAFTVTTDTWTGSTDVSSGLDWSPGYPLDLQPAFPSGLPIKWATGSGTPTVEVRARGAYAI